MGPLRFELRTSAMSRRRHNRLDHEPISLLLPFLAPKCNSIVRIIIYISFGWYGPFLFESYSKNKEFYLFCEQVFAIKSYTLQFNLNLFFTQYLKNVHSLFPHSFIMFLFPLRSFFNLFLTSVFKNLAAYKKQTRS